MPFIAYQQVPSSAAVKSNQHLQIPAIATHCELQADTQAIRYTMDNETTPTASFGMLLLITEGPKTFLIEDLIRIKFIQGAGGAGNLNIHYYSGGTR